MSARISSVVLAAALASASAAASATAPAAASATAPAADDEPASYVNPLVGTGGLVPLVPAARGRYEELGDKPPGKHPFGGLTYPGAVVPFGMVALSPDANPTTNPVGHGWSAGYNYYDDTLLGFSHMHTSGNGRGFGHVLVVPTAGPLQLEPGSVQRPQDGYRSRFSHDSERAEAGSYRVFLDDHGIDAELTATARAGFHRYRFPRTKDAHLIIDLLHGLGKQTTPDEAGARIESPRVVTGFRRAPGSVGPVYFVLETSRPFHAHGIAADGPFAPGRPGQATQERKGKSVKVALDFDTTTDPVVLVKVGLSFVSLEGARANLKAEIPAWDFDGTKAEARRLWNAELGKVAITGGTPAERRTFYTALYHTFLAPFVFADRDGRFLGPDGKVHGGSGDKIHGGANAFSNHTFFSVWDTYRNVHPLFTVLQRARVPHLIRSMMAQAELGDGLLPNYAVAGRNGNGMVAMPGTVVVADAYLKGFDKVGPGFDGARAFAMVKENLSRDVLGLPHYRSKGWVAADRERMHAAAATLEFALCDHAAAEMAAALGRTDDAAVFRARAAHYKNVIDRRAGVGFARGRLADGTWRTPFDPRAVSHYQQDEDFIEANAWQYTFFAPHDVAGLAAWLGGRARFVAKLDAMFDAPPVLTGNWSADVTGLWGQYAAGNEQSLHVAYLYDWVGAPWKAQARIREIARRFYSDRPEGLAGNDDAGSLSSWYVWSALGFYPVNPVGGVYAIGSPFFDKAEVDVGGGKRFVVTARGNGPANVYIQRAHLNGAPLHRTYLTHAEITAGGTLTFDMGPTPNKTWGASPKSAPPSMSDSSVKPASASPRAHARP